MPTVESFIMTAVMIIIVVAGTFAMLMVYSQESKIPLMQTACEQRGGILLQRTYQSGKYTNSLYTCVKKDVVIDYDIEH